MKKPQTNRWYDQYENLSIILNLTDALPSPVKRDVAKALIRAVENSRDIRHPIKLKSLGSEVVLSFYKSLYRQRWYDQQFEIRQAVQKMRAMTSDELQDLNEECEDIAKYVCTERANQLYRQSRYDHLRPQTATAWRNDEGFIFRKAGP